MPKLKVRKLYDDRNRLSKAIDPPKPEDNTLSAIGEQNIVPHDSPNYRKRTIVLLALIGAISAILIGLMNVSLKEVSDFLARNLDRLKFRKWWNASNARLGSIDELNVFQKKMRDLYEKDAENIELSIDTVLRKIGLDSYVPICLELEKQENITSTAFDSLDMNILFDKEHSSVIVGAAGDGKTSLLIQLVELWRTGKLCGEKFDLVFKISLNLLPKAINWIQNEGMDFDFYQIVYLSHLQSLSFNEGIDLSSYNIEVNGDILRRLLKDRKVLFLLDAYDEIADILKAPGDEARMLNNFLGEIYGNYQFALTTRNYFTKRVQGEINPKLVNANKKSNVQVVNILGFSPDNREQYIKNYFNLQGDNQANTIIEIINKNPKLQATTKSPLNLQLLCLVFASETANSNSDTNELITLTKIYDDLLFFTAVRFLGKKKRQYLAQGPKSGILEVVSPVLQILGHALEQWFRASAGLKSKRGEMFFSNDMLSNAIDYYKRQDEQKFFDGFLGVFNITQIDIAQWIIDFGWLEARNTLIPDQGNYKFTQRALGDFLLASFKYNDFFLEKKINPEEKLEKDRIKVVPTNNPSIIKDKIKENAIYFAQNIDDQNIIDPARFLMGLICIKSNWEVRQSFVLHFLNEIEVALKDAGLLTKFENEIILLRINLYEEILSTKIVEPESTLDNFMQLKIADIRQLLSDSSSQLSGEKQLLQLKIEEAFRNNPLVAEKITDALWVTNRLLDNDISINPQEAKEVKMKSFYFLERTGYYNNKIVKSLIIVAKNSKEDQMVREKALELLDKLPVCDLYDYNVVLNEIRQSFIKSKNLADAHILKKFGLLDSSEVIAWFEELLKEEALNSTPEDLDKYDTEKVNILKILTLVSPVLDKSMLGIFSRELENVNVGRFTAARFIFDALADMHYLENNDPSKRIELSHFSEEWVGFFCELPDESIREKSLDWKIGISNQTETSFYEEILKIYREKYSLEVMKKTNMTLPEIPDNFINTLDKSKQKYKDLLDISKPPPDITSSATRLQPSSFMMLLTAGYANLNSLVQISHIFFAEDDTEIKGFHIRQDADINPLKGSGIAISVMNSNQFPQIKGGIATQGNTQFYWQLHPDCMIDPRTNQPIFTISVWHGGIPRGGMKLFGIPKFCRSNSGERHNVVELNGILENMVLPEKSDTICDALPPRETTFTNRIGEGAMHGLIAGTSGVIQRTLEKQGVKKNIAHAISKLTYYAAFYAVRFQGHYSEMVDLTEPSTALFEASIDAAKDVAVIAGIEVVANGARVMGESCILHGLGYTGRFFKSVGNVIGVARFAPSIVSAFSQDDWASTGQALLESTAIISTGIATQSITEQVGNKVIERVYR